MTAQARGRGTDRAAMIVRGVRYAIYITVAIMLWNALSSFTFVRINEDDVSVIGISGLHRLLVERFDEVSDGIERGNILVFAMLDAMDQPYFRVSRVAALPGDEVGESDGFFTVNGDRLDVPVVPRGATSGRTEEAGQGDSRARRDLMGWVHDGFYLLLNDNPLSDYPDSRRIGLIDRRWVIGRFLSEMPF